MADYYSPEMLGLKTDQEVLGELVRTKLPAVAALMDGHGVLWTLVVSRWFICLFVDILPVEVSMLRASLGPGLARVTMQRCATSLFSLQTVLRIWDCLFNEGSKIIFRVALTLIKQHQAFILEATSFADICEKFKEITKGSFVMECHTFMQVSVWMCSACFALLFHLPGLGGGHPGFAQLSVWQSACPCVSFGPLSASAGALHPSPSQAALKRDSSPFQAHILLEPRACQQIREGHLPRVQWLLPLLLCH